MKELSIEEKAKAYDVAIKRLEDIKTGKCQKTFVFTEGLFDYIFPELKESEDEKIRKTIIDFVNEYGDKFFSTLAKGNAVAWLEKQGEQKLYVNDNAKEMFINALERVEEQNAKGYKLTDCDKNSWWEDFKAYTYCTIEQKTADKVEPKFKVGDTIKCKHDDRQFTVKSIDLDKGIYTYTQEGCGNDIDYADEEFELVEQKPIDKVEPKFKNGQWIVWQDKCYKVNYNGCGYELIDQNGLSTSLEYGTVEESAQLWDIIKEAKDGDVLVASDGSIFLFKGAIDCACKHYVALTTDGAIKFNEGLEHYWETSTAVHPATKEQRDLLFSKMKEAGYEWSDKYRKLIKIVK